MKLMIDIPEETYNKMRRGEKLYPADANVAIFAIETGTPLSESEDCVSRQAVMDCFKKWQPYMATRLWDFEKELSALPPVTAEKVGRWIKIDDCSNSGYYCSECHKRVVKEGWSDTVKIIKYCPNCGARMREVEECK